MVLRSISFNMDRHQAETQPLRKLTPILPSATIASPPPPPQLSTIAPTASPSNPTALSHEHFDAWLEHRNICSDCMRLASAAALKSPSMASSLLSPSLEAMSSNPDGSNWITMVCGSWRSVVAFNVYSSLTAAQRTPRSAFALLYLALVPHLRHVHTTPNGGPNLLLLSVHLCSSVVILLLLPSYSLSIA